MIRGRIHHAAPCCSARQCEELSLCLQAVCCGRQEVARREGKVFVAPYDDPYTIAGQGTIGKEIMEQLTTSAGDLHAIFVPIGGGGLIAGIAAYVKALCPSVLIIGVEPSGEL